MVRGCARRPPRARRARIAPSRGAMTIYRLRDEPNTTILVACTKCDWRAAFDRDELIAAHGADYPLRTLVSLVPRPRLFEGGITVGAYHVKPIEGGVGAVKRRPKDKITLRNRARF